MSDDEAQSQLATAQAREVEAGTLYEGMIEQVDTLKSQLAALKLENEKLVELAKQSVVHLSRLSSPFLPETLTLLNALRAEIELVKGGK